VKIAIVVDHIQLLMQPLNLLQNLLFRRSVYTFDHAVVEPLEISAKEDVEVDRTAKTLHVVPAQGIDHIGKRNTQGYQVEELVKTNLAF